MLDSKINKIIFWSLFKDKKFFIRTKNKIPLETFDKAKKFDDLKYKEEISFLIPKNLIVIDCDVYEDSKVIKRMIHQKKLNCIVMHTERGMHFIFKNFNESKNLVKSLLPIGILVDVRSGNSNGYIVIKKANVFRKIQIIGDIQKLSKIPLFLRPLRVEKINCYKWYEKIRLCPVGARNNVLTEFKALLNFLETKDIIKIVKLINEFVFFEKLPEAEVNKICDPKKIEMYKSRYKKNWI